MKAKNITEFCRLVNDMAKAGQAPYVERHLTGRMGPVYEAKPLGFGTGDVMLKLSGGPGGWVTVDPQMCEIWPGKERR